jgi:hypothetical protein
VKTQKLCVQCIDRKESFDKEVQETEVLVVLQKCWEDGITICSTSFPPLKLVAVIFCLWENMK